MKRKVAVSLPEELAEEATSAVEAGKGELCGDPSTSKSVQGDA